MGTNKLLQLIPHGTTLNNGKYTKHVGYSIVTVHCEAITCTHHPQHTPGLDGKNPHLPSSR